MQSQPDLYLNGELVVDDWEFTVNTLDGIGTLDIRRNGHPMVVHNVRVFRRMMRTELILWAITVPNRILCNAPPKPP